MTHQAPRHIISAFLARPSREHLPGFLSAVAADRGTEHGLRCLHSLVATLTGEGEVDLVEALGRGETIKLFYTFLRLILGLTKADRFYASDSHQGHHMQKLVMLCFLHSVEMATTALSVSTRFVQVYGGDCVAAFTEETELVKMQPPRGNPSLFSWLETPYFFHFTHYVVLVAGSPAIGGESGLVDLQRNLRVALTAQLPVWLSLLHSKYQFTSLDLMAPFLFLVAPPPTPIPTSMFILPLQDGTLDFLILDSDSRYQLVDDPSPPYTLAPTALAATPAAADLVFQHLFCWALAFHLTRNAQLESLTWMAIKGLAQPSHLEDTGSLRMLATRMMREQPLRREDKRQAARDKDPLKERASVLSMKSCDLRTDTIALFTGCNTV
eukprot:Protomagalhaensia_sp_Gyna_25__4274@NODE_38_length_6740_cov_65_576929_g27_i0_p2_GENE_NODE_38_length_6740_cov_65_576929_g27_i0NODE_38_length_6740_cov_65_576929_g27_i0_p2_ORF_typecomplete_len382_score53_88_NODE_38_length_6740_cov_65_576929_g27_i0211166